MFTKYMSAALMAVVISASNCAHAEIVTVDPDNSPAGTDIGAATLGVTLSSVPHIAPNTRDPIVATDWFPPVGNIFASPANSSIVFSFQSGQDTRDAVFRADFDVPTDFVSIVSVVASDQNFMSLRAFGVNDTLIASSDATGANESFTHSITRPSAEIAYILAGGTNELAANGLDLLEFNRIVPNEPFPAAFELRSLLPAAGGDGTEGFVLKGIDAEDLSGISVSNAGDVNGDGIDDFIIGAEKADPDGRSLAGESYVVFGSNSGFPAALELSSLFPAAGGDGTAGFVLMGVNAFDVSGNSVSNAGDVNGDGIDDLIIGAAGADPNGVSNAGESFVVFGRNSGFPAVFALRSLIPAAGGDGAEGFVLKGIDSDDHLGTSVSNAGDVNGDGIDDFIIGAFNGAFSAGESYVVFGRMTGFPATFELSSLLPAAGGDGTAGFVLKGIDSNDFSGTSVSNAGDVNGDGIDDLIIGADKADPDGKRDAGESYVVFGRNTGFPATFALSSLFPAAGGDGTAGFVLKGIDSGDASGTSVSNAGDVNGDGIDDLIIGAYFADPNGIGQAGESSVVFGRNTGFPAALELSSLFPAGGGDGTAGFVLKGIVSNDLSGTSVSNAGDVNGDGIDDFIIGAHHAKPNGVNDAGESYVVFGRAP